MSWTALQLCITCQCSPGLHVSAVLTTACQLLDARREVRSPCLRHDLRNCRWLRHEGSSCWQTPEALSRQVLRSIA